MGSQNSSEHYSSWLEVSKSALQNNIWIFREISHSRSKIGLVLKGNAYGHGLETIFPIIHSLADYIYVMTAQEALKLDIGLSREGLQRQNLQQSLWFLKQSQSSFQVIGLMSHFANTEDVTEQSYAKFQLDEFRQMAQELKNTLNLPSSIENHIGASATALVLPEAR